MGKLVMAYWDCPSCGSKGLRGDQQSCPNCGRARGEVKFYLKGYTEGETREENERGDIEYVDEERAKNVSRNPDWYCSFCHSLNSDNAPTCKSCGASRESSEANYFQMHEKLKARQEAKAQPETAAQPAKKKRSLLPFLLIAAAIIGLIMFMTSNKTRGDYQVKSLSWARVIAVEQNVECQESDWSVPAGGTITRQQREIHHYNSVIDHYENVQVQRSRQVIDHYETYYTYTDRGNGYYEEVAHERPVYDTEYYTETESRPVYRQDPVYATKYFYTIWRWKQTRTADASGEGHNAEWPDPNLAEDERESDRSAAYRVTIQDLKNQSIATYRMKEEDWRAINEGDKIFITATRTGSNPYISDQKGEKLYDLFPDR